MKIGSIRRFSRDDFPGMEEHMEGFFEALNPMMDDVVTALQRKLTPEDNLNATVVHLTMEDQTEYDVSIDELRGRPVMAMVVRSEHYDYLPNLAWAATGEAMAKVKVKWGTTPSEAKEVSILFIGEGDG